MFQLFLNNVSDLLRRWCGEHPRGSFAPLCSGAETRTEGSRACTCVDVHVNICPFWGKKWVFLSLLHVQPCPLRLAQCKCWQMEARRSCCLLLERMKLKGRYSHPAMIPAAFLLSPSFQLCPSRFPHCFPVPRLLVRTWIPTRVPANPAASLKTSQRFSCSMAPASFYLRFPSYQLIT